MNLLCTGDLHVGVGMSWFPEALADTAAVLAQITELAATRNVDAILAAGDLFHRPRPTPPELHVFQRFARELEQLAIPTYAIVGDLGHDQSNVDQDTALELFDSAWLHVSKRPELIRAVGDIGIAMLPAVSTARLSAVADTADRGFLNDRAADALMEIAADLRAQVPVGWPTVLLGHWAVRGAALPNGLPAEDFGKPMLDAYALADLGFDAVVLGDIHRPQRLVDGATPVFYVGSPSCQNFGEAGHEHGLWLLELEAGSAMAEFVALESRRFVTVDVDLTQEWPGVDLPDDPTDWIAAEIASAFPLQDAVVRIRYKATEEQHRRVDRDALKRLCADAGAARVYQIAPEIIRASRARAEVDETLEPLAALDAWTAANGVEPAQASPLRDLTGELLAEVTA